MIDGIGVGDVGNIVLRDRHLLAEDGIFIAVVTLDPKNRRIAAGPEIQSRGFVYVRESEALISDHSILFSCKPNSTISLTFSSASFNNASLSRT